MDDVEIHETGTAQNIRLILLLVIVAEEGLFPFVLLSIFHRKMESKKRGKNKRNRNNNNNNRKERLVNHTTYYHVRNRKFAFDALKNCDFFCV